MPDRVLIVSAGLLHEGRDPRTIRARRLIEGLGRRGLEVDLLGLWAGAGRPPPVEGVRRLHAVGARIDWEGARGGEGANSEGLAGWIERAEAELAGLAAGGREKGELPDVVYAIGVPVSALAAGAAISGRLDLPLVLDLGDPWPARSPEEREHRRRVLAAAAALVTTTPELAARLEPLLTDGVPTLLAPAGGELRTRAPRPADAPPLVVHMGAINAGRVDPVPAFSALAALHRAGRIEFRSHSTGWHPAFDRLPQPHLPMLSHAEALDLLAEAAAALVLANDDRAQLPSKVFEIACTETWALCVSERDPDSAVETLRRSGHAVAAAANEKGSITAAVERVLDLEARGVRPAPAPEHSWERRLDRIAELLARLRR